MENRKGKVINGFVLKTIYMVLNVALAFFMMPFILHSLGDRMYGIWIMIGAVMGYSAYLDFGLSSAVSRFISRAIGRNDMDEVNGIVNTSFLIYLAIGAAAAAITVIAAISAERFVASAEDLSVVRVLILLLGFNIALGFPTRAFGGLLGANLRYGITEGIELTGLLLRNALILALFSLGYGIITLGLILFGVSLLSYVLYTFFAFRTVSPLKVDFRLFSVNRAKELFSYSFYTFVYRLAEILIFRVDALVVGAYMGASAVAHYAIASTLVSYFIYFIYNTFSLMGPVYSQDEGRGDGEKIKRNFLFTTRLSVYSSVLIGAMTMLYGDFFIERWMGPGYLDAYPPLTVLVAATLAMLMQMPSSTVLYSISRHKFLAFTGVIEGVLNLALSLYLVREHGLFGVALGTAIPMVAIRLLVQPFYVCRAIGIRVTEYYINTLGGPALLGVLAIGPLFLALRGFAMPDYTRIMLLGCVQVLAYSAAVFAFGFTDKERVYMLDYLGKWFRRPAPAV